MIEFIVGLAVCVGPNLLSSSMPDRREKSWEGRVVYITEESVGVKPLNGDLTRDVLKKRVENCESRK